MNTNQVTKFDHNIALIRHATPLLELVEGATQSARGVLLTQDNIQHFFDGHTSVAENARMYGLDKVQSRFMDSTLFVGDNDELLDYRLGGYNGIIHSNDTIESFIKHLGAKPVRHDGIAMMASATDPIDVKLAEHLLGVGGHSQLNIEFAWSPFVTDLRSIIQHVRLVCLNGAKLRTKILQNDVRVVNDWERHIDIARTVLSNRTEKLLGQRMEQMYNTVAPMSLVDNIRSHATIRRDNPEISFEQRMMLDSILDLTDVVKHGDGKIAQSHVDGLESRFKDRCPSHMPLYSLFNLATEMNTHTPAVDGSSQLAVDRLTNRIVFNDEQIVIGRSQMDPVFNDPEAALSYHLAA